MNIWMECKGQEHIHSLQTTAWRMVEIQQPLSTRKLVDSSEEEKLLDELIESTMPQTFGHEFYGLHKLLYTPFRYPPLKIGTRFANLQERSLWYGSLHLPTVLAEKAYYQFLFLSASLVEFGNVLRTFTAFNTKIKTEMSIDLLKPTFGPFLDSIVSPNRYSTSQALGHAARNHHIAAMTYPSARDPGKGTNIALFTPNAFLSKKPQSGSFQTWQTLATHSTMEFKRMSTLTNENKIFKIDHFMVDGVLPYPAVD